MYLDNVKSKGTALFVFGANRENLNDLGFYVSRHDQNAKDHFTYYEHGEILSCDATFAAPRDLVRTTGGQAVVLEPMNDETDADENLEITWSIAVEAGNPIAVMGYFRKTAAYDGATAPTVTLSGMGITETSASVSASDTWELFTLSGTPTVSGSAQVTISCIGTAGYVYLADWTVLSARVNTGDFSTWYRGLPSPVLFATQVDAIDIAQQAAIEVWDAEASSHTTAGTFGAKNQKVVPSETIGDYKADVSTIEADIKLIKVLSL
jgi:hypothetical protein